MKPLIVARAVAAVISVIMVVHVATVALWRDSDPFLVPDTIVAVLLAVCCLLPNAVAPTVMLFSFGWTAGVLTVSVFTYVVRGEFAWPNFGIVVASLAMAVLLHRHGRRGAEA
ncbi:hypothetical protein GCM10023259_056140 [Thermocatellispora tengchongensis]